MDLSEAASFLTILPDYWEHIYSGEKGKITSLCIGMNVDTIHDWLFCAIKVFWYFLIQLITPKGKIGHCSHLWSEMNMGCGVPVFNF